MLGNTTTIQVGGATEIIGATIAAVDNPNDCAQGGECVDNGQLSLETESLEFAHLNQRRTSEQRSAGISTSVSAGHAANDDTNTTPQTRTADAEGELELRANTTNIQYSNESQNSLDRSLATVGQGAITVREDTETGEDSTENLNRNVQARERSLYDVNRQQGEVDITIDHAQVRAATAQAAELVDKAITEIQVLTTTADAQSQAIVGDKTAEQIFDAFIRRGYTPAQARSAMQNEGFQQHILGTMAAITDASENAATQQSQQGNTGPQNVSQSLTEARDASTVSTDSAMLETGMETETVTQGRQETSVGLAVLDGLGSTAEYLGTLDERGLTAAEIALAAAQGPKGIIELVVSNALEDTVVGQTIAETTQAIGQTAAEYVTGEDLGGDESMTPEDDQHLITGGTLGAAIVTGAALGRLGFGRDGDSGNSSNNNTPDTNPGERPGGADAEAGTPYGGADPRTSSIDYDNTSTARSGQATAPRDLNEQAIWSQVKDDPASGKILELSNDSRFPREAGWTKRQVSHELPDGSSITIHYQYNSHTGKAYDMKFTTPQRDTLQPGPTFQE